MLENSPQNERYLNLLLNKINVCRLYKPKFGQGVSVTLPEFEQMYGNDPFYSWMGLNHSLIYAAHKAAGGVTSLYRQIGIACEELFRLIIQDQFKLTASQSRWSYSVSVPEGKQRSLFLDGRIEIAEIQTLLHQDRVRVWLNECASLMQIDAGIASVLKGAVFEVRQGYKSKDSKRQNADITNASTAYAQGYLPVLALFSTQIDYDIVYRYKKAGWCLLLGDTLPSATTSTYAFCSQILDFDLAAFFRQYSPQLKEAVEQVVRELLSPDEP